MCTCTIATISVRDQLFDHIHATMNSTRAGADSSTIDAIGWLALWFEERVRRPLDCPSTDRSLRLATDATIYRSRPGLRLWRCRHQAASSNGYTGSADLTTVAMPKWILGEAHRFDPTGLSRPCCCVRRAASAPSAEFLPKILHRGSYQLSLHKDAPIPRAVRLVGRAGDATSERTAPPIFQSVSFRQGQTHRPCVELFESIADLSLSEVPSACRAAFLVRTTISGVVTSWRIWSATARADLGSSRTA